MAHHHQGKGAAIVVLDMPLLDTQDDGCKEIVKKTQKVKGWIKSTLFGRLLSCYPY